MVTRPPEKSSRRENGAPEQPKAPDHDSGSGRTRRWRLAIVAAALISSTVTAFLLLREARESPAQSRDANGDPPQSTPAALPLQAAARPGDESGELAARSERARLALGRGDWAEAWQQTQAILRESPGDPLALTYQALVRFTMGQPEAAILMLEQAHARAPELLDTYAILGLIYAKTGRLDLAQQVMDNAEERFPTRRQLLGQMFAELRSQVVREVASADSPSHGGRMIPSHGASADTAAMGQIDPGELRAAGVVALADPSLRLDGAVHVLFVIAHDATNAKSPPLALLRLKTGRFPVRFALHDGDSVLGQPLPERFRIEARLDDDGDPETRSAGDLVADSGELSSGASEIELELAPPPP